MAAIFRFLSRRFTRKKTTSEPAPSHVEESLDVSKTKKNKKSDLECQVVYLDGTQQTFYLPKNANAAELFDIAFAYVGVIEEKDYFGLKFVGKRSMWLDSTKGIHKQCKKNSSYPITFQVKFFASDPHTLRDEYTRYLVVLQLREYLYTGHLPCADIDLAAELAALLLQSEFGDFDRRQHTPAFVSTFRFLPETQQTENFDCKVLEGYKKLSQRNITPSVADTMFLEKARHLPDYGVDTHIVKSKTDQEYHLGLTPAGILVYEGSTKIGLFFWPKILKIEMNRNRLNILVAEENETSRQDIEHAFCFVLPDNAHCKELWKSAIEHHAFFRLTDRTQPPPKRNLFFRLRSRFYASSNTEYQMHNKNVFGSSSLRRKKGAKQTGGTSAPSSPTLQHQSDVRKASSFRRNPSQRFTARPSFSQRGGGTDGSGGKRAKRHPIPPTSAEEQVEVFNVAREVVHVERACVRDVPWIAPRPFPSPEAKRRYRNRSSVLQSSPTTTVPEPAFRLNPIGPQSDHGFKQQNGGQFDKNDCFEVTV